MTSVAVQDAARERALRTLKQQLPLDLAVVLLPAFIDVLAHTDNWGTKDYWVLVGVSVGKTVLGMLLAYVMRIKNPPKEETTK